MAICIQILLTEIVGNETNKVTYLKLRIKFYIMNVWVEERKDRTVGLSDDNRPAAVKYYQLTRVFFMNETSSFFCTVDNSSLTG